MFKAWLLFFLVATIGGAIVGAAMGLVLGAAMGAAGLPIDQIQQYCGIAGFIIALPVSFVVYRWSVLKFILRAE